MIAIISHSPVAKKRFQGLDFDERMSRQETIANKAMKADFTLFNHGDLTPLKQAVSKLASQLKE